MGNLLWGLPFPFSPKFHVSLNVEFYKWRPTLACPRPDDSCLLRLVWLASFVATGELPSLRDFFFQFNFSYIPLPCPAVSSPTSLSQSVVLCHSLSISAFFFPCVRSPVVWFGSSFLSSPRAFSPIKGKQFFPLLPFSSLCLSRPFLLSFDLHSRSSQMLLTFNSAVVFVMWTLCI